MVAPTEPSTIGMLRVARHDNEEVRGNAESSRCKKHSLGLTILCVERITGMNRCVNPESAIMFVYEREDNARPSQKDWLDRLTTLIGFELRNAGATIGCLRHTRARME